MPLDQYGVLAARARDSARVAGVAYTAADAEREGWTVTF